MDEEIRKLEREAKGDPEAASRLAQVRRRTMGEEDAALARLVAGFDAVVSGMLERANRGRDSRTLDKDDVALLLLDVRSYEAAGLSPPHAILHAAPELGGGSQSLSSPRSIMRARLGLTPGDHTTTFAAAAVDLAIDSIAVGVASSGAIGLVVTPWRQLGRAARTMQEWRRDELTPEDHEAATAAWLLWARTSTPLQTWNPPSGRVVVYDARDRRNQSRSKVRNAKRWTILVGERAFGAVELESREPGGILEEIPFPTEFGSGLGRVVPLERLPDGVRGVLQEKMHPTRVLAPLAVAKAWTDARMGKVLDGLEQAPTGSV